MIPQHTKDFLDFFEKKSLQTVGFERPFDKPEHFVSYLQCPVVFKNIALMCPIIDSI